MPVPHKADGVQEAGVAKVKTVYVCRSCGSAHHRWMGKCPDCDAWDSLEQTVHDPAVENDPHRAMVLGWTAGMHDLEKGEGSLVAPGATAAMALPRIGEKDEVLPRLPTGIGEFDRVLGMSEIGESGDGRANGRGEKDKAPRQTRGIVPGSAVLVGGEPGIGKSTLLLQAALAWAGGKGAGKGGGPARVLYVSSEESAEQVKQRAMRLQGGDAAGIQKLDELFILADTNVARIIEQTHKVVPRVLLIDSVQMIYKPDLPAGPGSVTQLRRCCAELIYLAKLSGIAVVLVGHVTKDGNLAGPRLLEHLVDAVLYFEGDRSHSHRVVRAVKNRFGTTLEIGLFEMTGQGLNEVPDAAGVAALPGGHEPRPGCVVCPTVTGTRCVMVEVQALTATGFLGAAKRKCSGLDANRLAMLIAVLEQHAGLRLADRDIFASSVGGLRVVEPASDLSLLLAIAGSHYKRSLRERCAVVGEVGLSGEIRPVPQLEARVREAARLGYTRLIVPEVGGKGLPKVAGIELVRVKDVGKAMEELG